MTEFTIHIGGRYEYTANKPDGCKGAHYRVHREVLDVPSYQQKLLVEGLTGQDTGLWFVVTPSNFSYRYKYVPEPVQDSKPPVPVPEKVLTILSGSDL